MALEQLAAFQRDDHAPLGTQMDAWPLGVIILELLGGQVPASKAMRPADWARALNAAAAHLGAGALAQEVFALMRDLLQEDPATRCDMHTAAARLEWAAQAAAQELLAYEALLANMHTVRLLC